MLPKDLIEAFRQSLISGSYNLLVGAGISLDSKNGNGKGAELLGAEALRSHLCKLTSAKESTGLNRVYPLLTKEQVATELFDRYSNCKPGPSVALIDKFLWRRIFTFNIDDVLENVYSRDSLQELSFLNYDSPFEPTPARNKLQIVHLHGSVRRPESGLVFSNTEYARNMGSMNPWMHTLSERLATEPFIIAGTSLNEMDLEYYLSHRNASTPRRGLGPSLLIEPSPDAVTISDCNRHGLVLVKATFGDFLSWLHEEIPTPPTLAELVIPNSATLFAPSVTGTDLLNFFLSFQLISATDINLPASPSPFMMGREPDWEDINQHYDIERSANVNIGSLVKKSLIDASAPRLLLTTADAGTGKSTTLKRVGHNLAMTGQPVLTVRTLAKLDVKHAVKCLDHAVTPLLLLVDNFADHAEQVRDILEEISDPSKLVILGAERSYRDEYVRLAIGRLPHIKTSFSPLRREECQELLGRYQQFGLVADKLAQNTPAAYAMRMAGEPVAVSVCQILNDFRPLDKITQSLWAESKPEDAFVYLCAALAQYCYSEGIRYSILQAAVGMKNPITSLFGRSVPLKLAYNILDNDYVVPLQAIIAERVLHGSISISKTELFNVFVNLARTLAPHVNRKSIIARSPEARLAGRLFDSDKVVKFFSAPLLKHSMKLPRKNGIGTLDTGNREPYSLRIQILRLP